MSVVELAIAVVSTSVDAVESTKNEVNVIIAPTGQSNKWPACWPVTFAAHETEGLLKMSFSKYTKRRGQFEALEAKQLFAADLVGGAAADLPDTVVVAENISEDDFVIIPLNVRFRRALWVIFQT